MRAPLNRRGLARYESNMNFKQWMIVGGLAMTATACGPMTRAEKVAATTGNAMAGQSLYASCASCHGSDGKGTASGPSLVDAVGHHSSTQLIQTIIDGVPGTTMASYSGLTDQQLADIYAHIKQTLAK